MPYNNCKKKFSSQSMNNQMNILLPYDLNTLTIIVGTPIYKIVLYTVNSHLHITSYMILYRCLI